MKNYLIFTLLLFITLCGSAQEIAYKINSTEILKDKLSKLTFNTKAIGQNNHYLYFLCFPYNAVYPVNGYGTTTNYILTKCDNTPQVILKKELILKFNKQEREFKGIFFIKGQLFLFSSFQNVKQKKHYLFVQKVNKETLEPDDSLTLVGNIDYEGYSKFFQTNFNYAFSEDSSKLLIYYNLVNNDQKIVKYAMYVYNDDINILWKKENLLPDTSKGLLSHQKYSINNEGTVLILCKKYSSEDVLHFTRTYQNDKFFSMDPNYNYQLFKCTKNNNEYINLNIPDNFIVSLTFQPNDNNNILCAGIFSLPKTLSAKGSFSFEMNLTTKKISNLDTKEFEKELLPNYFTENPKTRQKENIPSIDGWDPFDYLLSDIKSMKNGGKYFVAEQYIKGSQQLMGRDGLSVEPIFYNDDLIVIHLTNNNKIKHNDKIIKRQYTLTLNIGNSYSIFEKDNDLYFAFSDYIKKNSSFSDYKMTNTFLVKLDSSGKQVRTILKAEDEKPKFFTLSQSSIQTGSGELMYSTMANHGNKYTFEKLIISN